jgi:uncharacterized lipoprotein YbaY
MLIVVVQLAFAASTALHARPDNLSLLKGTIALSDGSAIPEEAQLRVNLRDLSPGVAKDASVATQTFTMEGRPPIQFELPYDASRIEPKRLYGVAAVITNSRGQALWETRVPIRVLTLGNQTRPALVLRPIEKPKAPPEPTAFTVECGELRFKVRLDEVFATIEFPDSKVVLPRTQTMPSKRWSDGPTTLSISGTAAYFQWQSRAYRDCKVTPD